MNFRRMCGNENGQKLKEENFFFSVKSFEEILLPAPACYFKRY